MSYEAACSAATVMAHTTMTKRLRDDERVLDAYISRNHSSMRGERRSSNPVRCVVEQAIKYISLRQNEEKPTDLSHRSPSF